MFISLEPLGLFCSNLDTDMLNGYDEHQYSRFLSFSKMLM